MLIASPIIIIWFIVSFSLHRRLIFKFSGAREIERKEYPEIYNIVENLCISRWLPVPHIWILDDDSYNAFATWRKPEKSWIVFSRWIINKLDKSEIEAVAWHELTHIMNKDTLLMVCVIVFIGIIGLVFPFIRLAISRKREFLADAGSVELTKDKNAMISALRKISTDSRIESIKKQTVASMCIETPFQKDEKTHKIKWFRNLLKSHPPIEERIAMLKNY